ncbi:MAG: histidine--tRNA ligase [Candidatus Omnitrophica bacterium]|nr:histidine--tRNA ligase [Candidatus Omnitrophota bacterium]
MARKIESLRGMEDILPGEIEKWQFLEERARFFFESRGFKEIRTPVLEYTDLFSRSVGEASDIVHKEMFSFEDRGGRNITLRPEMTASVARAVIEKGLLTQAKFWNLYYWGPMFRAERPQAGRKRQFHQIGIEMINQSGPACDLEAITLLYDFLNGMGLQDLRIRLNDLGTAENQERTAKKLREFFSKVSGKLCNDCQWRLEKNVLRVFDCKTESCQKMIEQAPWEEISPLSDDFKTLEQALRERAVPYEVNRRLVRGLDYYNGTVFEIAHKALGAQDAVAGGGRYDRLYKELGGPDVPATGFSLGIERLLAVLEKGQTDFFNPLQNRRIYLANLESSREAVQFFEKTSLVLREHGFRIEMQPGETSLTRHLKKANQWKVRFVLILGSEELKNGQWTVKDMTSGEQVLLKQEAISNYLKGKLTL